MDILGTGGIVGGIIVLIIIFLVVVGLILTTIYKKASKESAFVRTGMGGEKVIKDGGAIVLPRFQSIQYVNMKTMKLEVARKESDALITNDRMRVDVTAEFFVRVAQDTEAISKAAQTLGDKTNNPEQLKLLVEGKFVDALRSVAASMNMRDLHEKRSEFVGQVQAAVTEDLKKNGLELESVSLTRFDQTNKEFFNQNNTFDAEGLTMLTQQIELRKQDRNKIEKETEVKIAEKNLEANREITRIGRENEQVRLNAEKEVEFYRNEQKATIAKFSSEQTLIAEQARLGSEQEIEQANLKKQREVALSKIENDAQIRQNEIIREQEVSEAKIKQEQSIVTARVLQEKEIELRKQEKAIEIAKKSEEEATASAKADIERAKQVEAAQGVITAELIAKANREKQISVIAAATEAEKEAVGLVKQAEARLEAARKESEAIQIEAEAKTKAAELEAQGALAKLKAQAEGERELNEAANLQSNEVRQMKIKLALFDKLPEIIAQSVKPIEKIDSIKIVDIAGLTNNGSSGEHVNGGSSDEKSLPEQVVNASLKAQVAKPLIAGLMEEAGLGNGVNVMNSIADYPALIGISKNTNNEGKNGK